MHKPFGIEVESVHVSHLVRLGGLAYGRPTLGQLYAELVEDCLLGRARNDTQYGASIGMTKGGMEKQVDLLVRWGVLERIGRTRRMKYRLAGPPNGEFCADVLHALFGEPFLEEVQAGARVAELRPLAGESDPVANYAMQVLLGTYGAIPMVSFGFSEPTLLAGTGRVLAAADQSWLWSDGYVLQVNNQLTTYPLTLPAGLRVEKLPPRPKQRAARKRALSPDHKSFAFMYHSLYTVEQVDTYWFPVIKELHTYWNEQFRTEERLSPLVYASLRNLLVEEGMAADEVRLGIRGARLDRYWSSRAELLPFAKSVTQVRKLARQAMLDPSARGTKVTVVGDDSAENFANWEFVYGEGKGEAFEW
jgi:hypothetical protein